MMLSTVFRYLGFGITRKKIARILLIWVGLSISPVTWASGFPNAGVDEVLSLSQFKITFTKEFAVILRDRLGAPFCEGFTISGCPPSAREYTSPMLYDPNTKIGRSEPHRDGDGTDEIWGADVCKNGTTSSCQAFNSEPVLDADFQWRGTYEVDGHPFDEGHNGVEEVHTQILSLRSTPTTSNSTTTVRAGDQALCQARSLGEIESLDGDGFPAESFFQMYLDFDIDLNNDGKVDIRLFNESGTDEALVFETTGLTGFPPENIIYSLTGNGDSAPELYLRWENCQRDLAFPEHVGWLRIMSFGVNVGAKLTVNKAGTGTGNITGQYIDCNSDCTEKTKVYFPNTQVTLTATANPGSTFTGWTDACSGTGTCQVTMNKAQSVTATFTLKNYALTVTKKGTGSGSVTGQGILCGSDCSEEYDENTQVSLTATPSADSSFVGWGSACSGTGACQVKMTQIQNVTATFKLKFALTVNKYGTGSGRVTGHGINCGPDCSEEYEANSTVTLIATADNNSIFEGWSGACSGMGNCTPTMNQAQNVMAYFKECTYQITSPIYREHGFNADTGYVTVEATSGCAWTARSNHIQIANITAGGVGKGDGTVTYEITANPTLQNRQGTLTIAGQIVTLNQGLGECSYQITPLSYTHKYNMENGKVTVTTTEGCPWNAHSNQSWATITAGLNGEGAGMVTYEITENTSTQNRQATITLAGQTFTVNQGLVDDWLPEPVFTPVPSQGRPPLTVTADGRKSSDKEGIIKAYAWTTSDGQTASTAKASFMFTTVGTYDITLTVIDEKDLSASKTETVTVIPASTRLINLSTRARIQGGAGDVFAGFGITGAGTQKILLRGISLEAGVDPQLLLQKYPTQEVLGSNNNWQEDPRHPEIPDYMRPLNATDAALLRDLGNGYYTVQLSSLAAKALGIVEVILVPQTPTPASQLFNISTRALVEGGAYDIIAGFIIEGEGLQKVVIRGTAVDAGVDPVLIVQELGKTEVMAQNNNWQDDSRAPEIPAHLQFGLKSTDAALLLALPEGAYTVILTSLGAKKLGLIEVVAVD